MAARESSTESWLASVDLQKKSREPKWRKPSVVVWSVLVMLDFARPGSKDDKPFYWAVFAVLQDGRYILAVSCETLEEAQRVVTAT